MFACMDASLKIVSTASHGITYTAYYMPDRKQTAALRYGFKLAHFQIHPPFNIITLPHWLTV
jgi:hypothetical protein